MYTEGDYRAALSDAIETLEWQLMGATPIEVDKDGLDDWGLVPDDPIPTMRRYLEVLRHLLVWHGGEEGKP